MSRKERWPFESSPAGLYQQALLLRSRRANGYTIGCEWHFHPTRKWRFDVAIPELKIGIEYQGLFLKKEGQKGGHQTIKGLRRDWEKIREAQLAGWIILPFGPDETRSGEAMNVIARAIESRLEGKAA